MDKNNNFKNYFSIVLLFRYIKTFYFEGFSQKMIPIILPLDDLDLTRRYLRRYKKKQRQFITIDQDFKIAQTCENSHITCSRKSYITSFFLATSTKFYYLCSDRAIFCLY